MYSISIYREQCRCILIHLLSTQMAWPQVGNIQEHVGTWFSKCETRIELWTPNECCFIWTKYWLKYATSAFFQSHPPNVVPWGATVNLAIHPGVFLSHLSYKPHCLSPDEILASLVKVDGVLKAESRVPLLQAAWPPTGMGTHITLVNSFTAWDGFLEWKLNSSLHSYHFVDLPGWWGEFENCDFFNLNIQNTSLLKLGNSEVEMCLALRTISYLGGSENLYSSHWDRPRVLSALLARYRDPVFLAVWVAGRSMRFGMSRLGFESYIWIFLDVWLWARSSNSLCQSSLLRKKEIPAIVIPALHSASVRTS